MRISLADIPGIDLGSHMRWRVVALELDGKSPVLAGLLEWKRNNEADYKKIMKVMRIAAQMERVRDPNHVKKSDNPDHKGVYEMRAHKGSARVMFFYSERDRAVIVCTNPYFKSKPSQSEQDNAFALCARMKALYESEG